MFICTNFNVFHLQITPTPINSTEAEDTEAAEEDTEAAEEEEDTIKEAMVEEEAIMTDRAVEVDTAEEEEIVTKAEDTKLFEAACFGVEQYVTDWIIILM